MTETLFHSEHLIALDKPSGLLVHRGWAQDEDTLLTQARQASGAFVYPLHRLDRGASGVVVFALSKAVARELGRAFAEQRVHKRYLALVRGIAPEHALIDHAIPRTEGGLRVAAQTEVRRIATHDRYSLVEARPLSGRLHQIRRHLKHLGHPLIGDVNYGSGEHNRKFRTLGLARLALHCFEIALPATESTAAATIRAALPHELRVPLLAFGFDSAQIDDYLRRAVAAVPSVAEALQVRGGTGEAGVEGLASGGSEASAASSPKLHPT